MYHTKTSRMQPLLRYFDAPTMIRYQVPSKAAETAYCENGGSPFDCEEYLGLDPEIVNIPMSHLEARKSTVGEYAGRGLFASQDIPKGSTFDIHSAVKSFRMMPSTWSIVQSLHGWAKDLGDENLFVENELSSLVTFTEGTYGSKIIVYHVVLYWK